MALIVSSQAQSSPHQVQKLWKQPEENYKISWFNLLNLLWPLAVVAARCRLMPIADSPDCRLEAAETPETIELTPMLSTQVLNRWIAAEILENAWKRGEARRVRVA